MASEDPFSTGISSIFDADTFSAVLSAALISGPVLCFYVWCVCLSSFLVVFFVDNFSISRFGFIFCPTFKSPCERVCPARACLADSGKITPPDEKPVFYKYTIPHQKYYYCCYKVVWMKKLRESFLKSEANIESRMKNQISVSSSQQLYSWRYSKISYPKMFNQNISKFMFPNI